MLKIILACILGLCGLFLLLAPKKYLVNPAKVKDEAKKYQKFANCWYFIFTISHFGLFCFIKLTNVSFFMAIYPLINISFNHFFINII